MQIWYKFFTYLLYPVTPIYLFIRKIRKKENEVSCAEKLAKIKAPKNNGFLIWFHVASVGEAMSILPIIENFIKEKKIDKILITSITLSSGKILKKKYSESQKVIHQFLPLDISTLNNKFLDHWKPSLSVFIDSEIWPNLILQTNERKIPLLLLNARITEKSFTRWKLIKNFAKQIFGKFDLCITANKESENFLQVLGARNIKNYGNLKFSQTKTNSNNQLDDFILNKIKNRKIWCAASTHHPEEILCAKSHIEVKKNFKNILTIIIPRHIDRVDKINKELSNLNLKVVLYSKQSEIDEKTDILIIDSYGESLKFYNISKCVFVGKSLVQTLIKNSGQNPIEPARVGCKIFHGPYVSNFHEIYKYLKTLENSREVKNSNELGLSLVEEFKKNKDKNNEIAVKIQNYGQNIFNNVIIELKKYI
tara:strand:+ start:2975 stop:4240 length:1266 start_codon:yes stop_codon:yes gene_type:complete